MPFTCDNRLCGRELTADHVILITTMHLRRFCMVECVVEGFEAHLVQMQNEVLAAGETGR